MKPDICRKSRSLLIPPAFDVPVRAVRSRLILAGGRVPFFLRDTQGPMVLCFRGSVPSRKMVRFTSGKAQNVPCRFHYRPATFGSRSRSKSKVKVKINHTSLVFGRNSSAWSDLLFIVRIFVNQYYNQMKLFDTWSI